MPDRRRPPVGHSLRRAAPAGDPRTPPRRLHGFRDHGQVHRDDLHPTAAALGVDLDDAQHQLSSADLVHSAPDGQIEIAYPFSGLPTGHTVHLAGHLPVAAMCAIDALGIPLMTATDGVIDSADPDTGTPIRIQRRGDEWTWQPATTVVVIGHTDCCGTLADTVCRSITFHTDQSTRSPTSTTIPNSTGFSSASPTQLPSPTPYLDPCSHDPTVRLVAGAGAAATRLSRLTGCAKSMRRYRTGGEARPACPV